MKLRKWDGTGTHGQSDTTYWFYVLLGLAGKGSYYARAAYMSVYARPHKNGKVRASINFKGAGTLRFCSYKVFDSLEQAKKIAEVIGLAIYSTKQIDVFTPDVNVLWEGKADDLIKGAMAYLSYTARKDAPGRPEWWATDTTYYLVEV